MTDDERGSMELTRRKALAGLGTIGAASAAAGAGTMALFSDTETSSGNTVTAGTLDLSFGSTNTTTLNVSDIAPGDSGSASITLNNDGSINGYVDLIFGAGTNREGDNPESEPSTTPDGDLGSVLDIDVDIGTTDVREGTFNNVFDGTEEDVSVPLNSNSSKDLTITYTLPTSAGNAVQGDEVEGDITVELGQQASQ